MVERASTALDASATLNGHAPTRSLVPDRPGVGVLSVFRAGDTTVEYQIDRESGQVGLRLYPTDTADALAVRREYLDEPETRFQPLTRAWSVDCLVQVQCVGGGAPAGYAQGRTMRNAPATLALRYERQELRREPTGTCCVETVLRHPDGWHCRHLLRWAEDEPAPAFEVSTSLENDSAETLTVEMLSSFSLGGITPFHRADAPGRLWAHRIRSYWSAEGRLESVPVEQWQLERTWQSHVAQVERFGQVGTLPARGFFPFAALEDRVGGVCWGAQLAWAGSWQMEFYRQGDCLSLSGGLADREFGHWTKTLLPGEALVSPTACLAVAHGDVDALCRRLMRHRNAFRPRPAARRRGGPAAHRQRILHELGQPHPRQPACPGASSGRHGRALPRHRRRLVRRPGRGMERLARRLGAEPDAFPRGPGRHRAGDPRAGPRAGPVDGTGNVRPRVGRVAANRAPVAPRRPADHRRAAAFLEPGRSVDGRPSGGARDRLAARGRVRLPEGGLQRDVGHRLRRRGITRRRAAPPGAGQRGLLPAAA